MSGTNDGSVAVVGGGVIGLAVAFELASHGRACTLIDPAPGRGASWAAAGMLSPAAEISPGEEPLVEDLRCAAAMWPDFAKRVERTSGLQIGLSRSSSILVGLTQSDARDLARSASLMRSSGAIIEPVDSEALHALEPSLASGLRHGWLLPDDHRVDNRLLVEGLIEAVKTQGVQIIEDRCVSVRLDRSAVALELANHGRHLAQRCVVATGAAQVIRGMEELGIPRVRPVRGTTLRLRAAPGIEVPTRTVRALVDGVHCYVVPRLDGSVVVGATSEEQGDASVAHAGGVFRLLEAARSVFPGTDELVFDEAAVGLRPATDEHLPFVAALRDPRVIAAVGHYRNGVLLCPLAGARVLEVLAATT